MYGTLELIETKHPRSPLRTEKVEGEGQDAIVLGLPFCIRAKGLEFGERLVTTSYIKSIDQVSKAVWIFSTEHSKYRWTLAQEAPAPDTTQPTT